MINSDDSVTRIHDWLFFPDFILFQTFELLQGGDVHVDGMAVTLPYQLDGTSEVLVKRTGRFVVSPFIL